MATSKRDANRVPTIIGVSSVDLATPTLPRVNPTTGALIAETTAVSYSATSTTSLAIATGSKTFTTQSGKPYLVGTRLRASSEADPADYMEGLVTSYSGTTLIILMDNIGGSGTDADWNINVAGDKGATGADSTVPGPAPAGQLFLSGAGMWPSTTSGCATNAKSEMATNKQNYYTLDFDKDAIEYAEGTIAMPSDWDAGVVTAKFHWMHPATTTNFKVAWALQGVSLADDDAGDASWGTAVQVNDIGGTTNDIYVSPASGNITIAGAGASELVQFRVYRVADDATNDTLAVDAKLLGVMVSFVRS